MDFFFLSVQLHFTIDQCKLLHDFSQIAQTNIQPLLHLFNGTLVERVLMFNADEGIIAMSLEMAHQSGPIHLTKGGHPVTPIAVAVSELLVIDPIVFELFREHLNVLGVEVDTRSSKPSVPQIIDQRLRRWLGS